MSHVEQTSAQRMYDAANGDNSDRADMHRMRTAAAMDRAEEIATDVAALTAQVDLCFRNARRAHERLAALEQREVGKPALDPVFAGRPWSTVRQRLASFDDGTQLRMAKLDALAASIVDDVLGKRS